MSEPEKNDRWLGLPVRCGQAESDFRVGDAVRLATRSLESGDGLVTGVQVGSDGFCYAVSWPGKERDTYHYGFELAADE